MLNNSKVQQKKRKQARRLQVEQEKKYLSIPPIEFDVTDLLRFVCQKSFYAFVQEFWDVVIPEDAVWNWHIELLCKELQIAAERVFAGQKKQYDLIVNIPPGTTKSTIVSVMFPAWIWTRMPSARILATSHAFDLGQELSMKCRDIVQSEKYQRAFPWVELREDQNTKSYFANVKGGWRKSFTVGGKSPIGFHAHFLLVDDPLNPQEAVSEADLKTANNFMSHTLPSRKVDKKVAVTVLVMQRLHQNDPTGHRLAMGEGAGKVRHICLPADLKEGFKVQPAYLKRYYKDGLLDPVRLDRSILRENRNLLGEWGYAGQFGQWPVPLTGGMFKVGKIVYSKTRPSDLVFKRIVRFWDKAASHDANCWTVGVKMGELEVMPGIFQYWVLDVVRGRWETFARENKIRETAERDGKKVYVVVELEPGSGGKDSLKMTIGRLAGYRVKEDKPTGDKALRAEPFADQMNGGNVILVTAPWNAAYVEELQFFPDSTYKDQVDASSGAFNALTTKRKKIGIL